MRSTTYDSFLRDGQELLETFTIRYPHGIYKESVYSSTYDDLSKWLRSLITFLKADKEPSSAEFVGYLNSFRGKLGNIDKTEFLYILSELERYKGNEIQ